MLNDDKSERFWPGPTGWSEKIGTAIAHERSATGMRES